MGGSGGGGGRYFSDKQDPKEQSQKLRKSEKSVLDDKFESEVSKIIASELVDYNDRDAEAVTDYLDTIKKALEKEIEGTIDLRFGGSVEKHTYVDGLSDIDSLVLLENSELKGKNPGDVLEYFYARLRDRFPNTDIRKGELAVTLSFEKAEIQLVPAIKSGSNLKISDRTGNRWSTINPSSFSEHLTSVNQSTGGKLVPTIKLVKAILSKLPESRRLSSYHTEALAVEIFRDYEGPSTPKRMLSHFFERAADKVLNPVTDETGQSGHVDDYLGNARSVERRLVSDSLGRLGRKIKNADGASSTEQWKEILGKDE